MMQYPVYASYPFNVYPYYHNYPSSGYNFGQTYGAFYGYQPWAAKQNSGMMDPGTRNASALAMPNGYHPNYQIMGSKYLYPQYSTYFQWSPYPATNWQSFNQASLWSPLYNYGKWSPMHITGGMYYSWPMMNYYSNQMMFPNYLGPTSTYWGVQQAINLQPTDSKQTKKRLETSSETKTLNAMSSEVIRDLNLPPSITKKTRSDIPRPSVDCSDMKESYTSQDDMEVPFLFRVSDTSIKQIASSRSFGPSMVYNTDSDNKPWSSQW